MIEVYERKARGKVGCRNPSYLGYIGKLAVSQVPKQQHPVAKCYREIVPPIIVKISDSARNAGAAGVDTRLSRCKLPPSAVRSVVHPNGMLAAAHCDQVEMALSGHIKHAHAASRLARNRRRRCGLANRLCNKRYRDHRADLRLHRRGILSD